MSGKLTISVAWLGLLLAMVSPPQGPGMMLCWFKACTGISCPGCGITRSLSCGLRGMFLDSWQYHPMGLLIWGCFLVTAVVSLLPAVWQDRLAGYQEAHRIVFKALYLIFIVSFIAFGTARAMTEILSAQ